MGGQTRWASTGGDRSGTQPSRLRIACILTALAALAAIAASMSSGVASVLTLVLMGAVLAFVRGVLIPPAG